MAGRTAAEIEVSVKNELEGTIYEASFLRPLVGGSANFIYHVKLQTPLPDGTTDVVVKHGEGYVAQNPGFPLTTSRCHIEEQSLRFLSQFPPSTGSTCEVRTPMPLHFNPVTSTQIQEYLPEAVSLKDYALEHYQAPVSDTLKTECVQLGRCLGEWLRGFHDWSQKPANGALRDLLATNKDMQNLKKMINYDRLLRMVDEYPSLLEECKDMFQKIADMVSAELKNEDSLKVIHGDFWTGNVLLPNKAVEDGRQVQFRIVDWEMAQLGVHPEDVGQIIAELWELKLYKDINAGLWIIQGLADGYGKMDKEFVFRTIIHVGAHLICIGSCTPGWGTPEQAEQVAKAGKEVLLKAWRKDLGGFKGHDLECLFN